MERLPSIFIGLFGILVLSFLTTGCGEKRKIEEEAQQVRAVVAEKRAIVKQLEAESAAVGHLGRYNIPRAEYLPELKDRIASLKQDGVKLVADREVKAESLKRMEEELSAYQLKFPAR